MFYDGYEIQRPDDPLGRDCNGKQVYVHDIVKVLKIPEFYFAEEEPDEELFASYRSYIGCYGIVRYEEHIKADNRVIWVGQNKIMPIHAVKADEEKIKMFDFVMSPDCIERVEFNFLLHSIFHIFRPPSFRVFKEQYASLGDDKGSMTFDLIKTILELSPERLKVAQQKVMETLPELPL